MEVWVTESRCIDKDRPDPSWAISEIFESRRIAEATCADGNESAVKDAATRDWQLYYRVRRYVPEPPPIPEVMN